MMDNIAPSMLAWLSREVIAGSPLWALLRANEYLEPDSAIRRALCRKAVDRMRSNPDYQGLEHAAERIIEGEKLAELPEKLQKKLMRIGSGRTLKQRYLPRQKLSYRNRKEKLRQRSRDVSPDSTARGQGRRQSIRISQLLS